MKTTKHRKLRGGLAFITAATMLFTGLPLNALAASPGSLDPTFGTAGKVMYNLPGTDRVNDVVVQTDGKIVIVGALGNDFGILRYNPNGTLDTTFGGDGIVVTDFSGTSDEARAAAIQSDGKIVAVGYTMITGSTGFSTAVARYLPNGALDPDFDTDGKAEIDVTPNASDMAEGVAIQDDGKIVISGLAGGDFTILRLNLGGGLNTAFDTDGIVMTDFGASNDTARTVIIQPDGKIIAAGRGNSNFAAARYNPNGSLDTTFDTDGKVTTDFPGNTEEIESLALSVDGKIVAAGFSTPATFTDSALARYNANGSPDTSFDTDGKVVTSIYTGDNDTAEKTVIQPDGKIITAGYSSSNFIVTRYNANGSLDAGFGTGGIILTDLGGTEQAHAGALSGDKLVVAGTNSNDFAAVRYNLLASPTAVNDFDSDGFSDYAVFRPSTSNWFILRSTDNTAVITSFGANGDVPLDGDFDGDGKSDLAIYRPSNGQWWYQQSSTGATFAATFGQTGDKPVPSDVDKDGKSDFVVWRPSNGNWYVLRSSDNFSSFYSFPFGANGDIPVGTAQ